MNRWYDSVLSKCHALAFQDLPSGYNSGEQYDTLSTGSCDFFYRFFKFWSLKGRWHKKVFSINILGDALVLQYEPRLYFLIVRFKAGTNFPSPPRCKIRGILCPYRRKIVSAAGHRVRKAHRRKIRSATCHRDCTISPLIFRFRSAPP
jgi:hypothetical protein